MLDEEAASLPLDSLTENTNFSVVAISDNSYAEYNIINNLVIVIKVITGTFIHYYHIFKNNKGMRLLPHNGRLAHFETNAETIGELCQWFVDNPNICKDAESVFADCKQSWRRKKALH